MKCIRRATYKDRKIINRLRIKEFSRSSEFDLLLADQLKWNRCDDTHIVLAAWANRRKAVATMRAVVVINRSYARACLQCSLPDQLSYPAIVFNSAATHIDYRRLGLNQAICYHFLLAAVRCGIEAILSPIYQGAPRIDFMKQLGYRFIAPEKNWQTKLLPKNKRILGILPRSQMGRAIDCLRRCRGEVIQDYPWMGSLFDFTVTEHAKAS